MAVIHIFAFVFMQMCACLKERTTEVIDCALRSLHGFQGSIVSWNRQDYNRQSMLRVKNNWSIETGLFLNARTQM